MKELLLNLNACEEARLWAGDKSWKEIYETCHRGDWLLWLFKKTNRDDLKLFTLAKGHCANTVRHLMKDERSIKAVDAAIAFGNGKITKDELAAAAAAGAVAAYDAGVYDAAAAVAAYAAGAVAAGAAYAAYDAYDAGVYDAAAAVAAYAAGAVAAGAAYAAYDAAVAAYAADAAYDAAYDAVAAAAAAGAAAAAKKANQLLTANIVRQYIPIDKWNINM
jgi:hypothetical protein